MRLCRPAGGDNEVQRTMLEIVNQLDGFDARGNIKASASVLHHAGMNCRYASSQRGIGPEHTLLRLRGV